MLCTVSGVTSTCQNWSSCPWTELSLPSDVSSLSWASETEGMFTRNRLRPKLANMATTMRQVMAMAIASRFLESKTSPPYVSVGYAQRPVKGSGASLRRPKCHSIASAMRRQA